jgi:hypothetical protein
MIFFKLLQRVYAWEKEKKKFPTLTHTHTNKNKQKNQKEKHSMISLKGAGVVCITKKKLEKKTVYVIYIFAHTQTDVL